MLSALLLLALSGASALVVQPAARPLASAAASSAVSPRMMADDNWQKLPIFDPDREDPIFSENTGYKGRAPYGFSNTAELFNGRAAMMGFVICFLQELIVGKGVLEQYGACCTASACAVAAAASRRPMLRDFRMCCRPMLTARHLFPLFFLAGLPYDAGAILIK